MYHLTKKSGNMKTGPIPVSTSTQDTCPDTCPLKESGCYAKGGPLAIHWSQVTSGKRGADFATFCESIAALPKNQLWRHNQAGDLPHNDGVIDKEALQRLTRANNGKRGFTYTHHVANKKNLQALRNANRQGFTVNMSANSPTQAAELFNRSLNIPIVTVSPIDAPKVQTINGVKIVTCPAVTADNVTCSSCGLCQEANRYYVIGFPAHGSSKKAANLIASA